MLTLTLSFVEIKSLFPGPYLCYYPLPTYENVKAAHEYIEEIIDEEGPFDGVIGFSQGAALASSMMLEHAKSNPLNDLFKIGIFAGASLPFDLQNDAGIAQWLSARSRLGATVDIGSLRIRTDGSGITAISDLPSPTSSTSSTPCSSPSLSRTTSDDIVQYDGEFAGELEEDAPGFPTSLDAWLLTGQPLLGRYHPEKTPKARIRVPTLHLIGDSDPYRGQSNSLLKLSAGESTVIRHAEGHRVPRDFQFQKKAALAMERIIHKVNTRHG